MTMVQACLCLFHPLAASLHGYWQLMLAAGRAAACDAHICHLYAGIAAGMGGAGHTLLSMTLAGYQAR
jgi:hypothetical protein